MLIPPFRERFDPSIFISNAYLDCEVLVDVCFHPLAKPDELTMVGKSFNGFPWAEIQRTIHDRSIFGMKTWLPPPTMFP